MNLEVLELLGETRLDLAASESASPPRAAADCEPLPVDGIAIGTLVGRDEQGRPLVESAALTRGVAVLARSVISLEPAHIGRQVVLLCARFDSQSPIIVGVLQAAGHEFAVSDSDSWTPPPPRVEAELDGRKLEFVAEHELVFRCGKSSVTLTKAGKIVIRGEEILSRANGANRVQGGSIQLN